MSNEHESVVFSVSITADIVARINRDENPVLASMSTDKSVGMGVISIPTSMNVDEDRLEGKIRKVRKMWEENEVAYVALQFENIEHVVYLLPLEAMEYLGGEENLMMLYLGYVDNESMDSMGESDGFVDGGNT